MLLKVKGNHYKIMQDKETGKRYMFMKDEDGEHTVGGRNHFKYNLKLVATNLDYATALAMKGVRK